MTPTSLRVFAPGGAARRLRFAAIALGLLAVNAIAWLALEGDWGDWGDTIGLWGLAAALLLYEPFELRATFADGGLDVDETGGLQLAGPSNHDMNGVRGATAKLAFVALERATGPEYLSISLPHLTTDGGRTSNEELAEFLCRLIEASEPDMAPHPGSGTL